MSRTTLIRGVVSVAVVATFLIGCSSGGGSGQTAAIPTATAAAPAATGATGATEHDTPTGLCAILTPDRAAAALGEPVGAPSATHDSTFANASCHYDSTSSDASITVWYHPGQTRAGWEAQMAKLGMTAKMSVAGIGEAAYRRDGTAANPRVKLAAFQGDHDIWVIIAKAGDPDALGVTAEQQARELLTAIG